MPMTDAQKAALFDSLPEDVRKACEEDAAKGSKKEGGDEGDQAEMDGEGEGSDEPAVEVEIEEKKKAAAQAAALTDAITKAVAPLQKKLDELTKANEALTLEKQNKEYEEKAKALLAGTSVMPLQDIVSAYKSKDEALIKSVETIVKSAVELSKTSAVFEELGKGTGADGTGNTNQTAKQKLDALAADVIAKAKAEGKNVSMAKAFTQVTKEHPDLYNEFVANGRK